MAVRRDMDVPAVQRVEMVRIGQIERVETLADGTGLVMSDGAERLDLGRVARAALSSDNGGDAMRDGIFHVRGVASFETGPGSSARVMYLLPLRSRLPVALAIKDWLWVEA